MPALRCRTLILFHKTKAGRNSGRMTCCTESTDSSPSFDFNSAIRTAIKITERPPKRIRQLCQMWKMRLHISGQSDPFQLFTKSFSMPTILDVDHFMT